MEKKTEEPGRQEHSRNSGDCPCTLAALAESCGRMAGTVKPPHPPHSGRPQATAFFFAQLMKEGCFYILNILGREGKRPFISQDLKI